jgi:hypothetical protein
MNIDYNDFYRLEVEITQVPDKQLYQLKLDRFDRVKETVYQRETYFFEPKELKQFVDYINEATNGII